MSTHADKTEENKSQSVSAASSRMQSSGESIFQFVDNRPEAIAQRKIQEMANNRPRVVQRVISQNDFPRLNHSLVLTQPSTFAQLSRDSDRAKCFVRRAPLPATGLEVADAPNAWKPISDADLQAKYSWPSENIIYNLPADFEETKEERQKTKVKGKDVLNTVGGGGGALTISEFAGDDLAMVHHTTGGGSDPHLTVENAHLSALHHIADNRTISGFDKGKKKKPDHEKQMAAYGSTPTDNLNFFAAGGNQEIHDLSINTYLRVIRHAMDQIANVPPVYGVEIVRSANEMAAQKGMDLTKLYLPKGAGQERQLFKAALNMVKMGLINIPAAITTAFKGYAEPKPQLTDPASGKVVKEGEAEWTDLQNSLVTAHFSALTAYLKTL
ncbi:hypothetical protein [Reichenbachiella sp.]